MRAARRARAALAWALCALPVLLGFVLPVLFMLRPLAADWSVLPWDRFLQWSFNSLRLGAISAALAVLLALLLAYRLRRSPGGLTRGVVQLAGLGYAVPGAVLVVGLLLPVGWLQQAWPAQRRRLLDHRHRAGHRLGLPGALRLGGPAVDAERLCAHPGQPRRHGAHAGHRRRGAAGAGALAAAASAPRRRRRCWCSSTS